MLNFGSTAERQRIFMKFKRSSCPITNVLDLLGDKWTLLVIRDLVLGKRRYQEFLDSPEEMASNILADRLNKLSTAGLIIRHAYQQNPIRFEYRLTEKGKGLEPILDAILVWGKKQFPGTKRFPRMKQPRALEVRASNRRTRNRSGRSMQIAEVPHHHPIKKEE
jgi:DNA-binding HxlR family transcriptional regulator